VRELKFWCNITGFNARRIKSEINRYKIDNNKGTKHEFKVEYEGY
jgi:hypothetical protein